MLLGSSADVRRREKASATRFDVKLLHLEDTLGNEKEVVVSLVASLKESIEEVNNLDQVCNATFSILTGDVLRAQMK